MTGRPRHVIRDVVKPTVIMLANPDDVRCVLAYINYSASCEDQPKWIQAPANHEMIRFVVYSVYAASVVLSRALRMVLKIVRENIKWRCDRDSEMVTTCISMETTAQTKPRSMYEN